MSAIFGVFALQEQPITRAELTGMDQALATCGPDGHDLWLASGVGLGQRLLHTTPESRYERQPLVNAAGNYVLVADSRLDERDALAANLGFAASERATLPDSALLLAAYDKWGAGCPEHLVGDFAFALWDQKHRTLFCARDQLGVKPFYYCHMPGRLFVFASQMAGLLRHPQVPQRLNELALAYYLVFIPELTNTFFTDCWRLPPAHTLQVRADGITLRRYWTPEPVQELRLASDNAYVEAARVLLLQAVHDRVRTVVPVGAHVTGGLDSSAIVCIAAARLRESARTLTGTTWSLPPQALQNLQEGELPFIQAVCAHAGITCHAPEVTPEAMYKVMTLQCGPPGVMPLPASEMAMHELMQAQGVRLLLSGLGGDEVISFNGRGYWAALALGGRWIQLAQELTWRHQRDGSRLLSLVLTRVLEPLLPDKVWRRCRNYHGDLPQDDPLRWAYIQPMLAHRLDLPRQCRGVTLRERPGVRANQLGLLSYGHFVSRMEGWSADAARLGLNYCYPLLDRRLLEFCLALPPEQYVSQGWTRYLFRRVIDGLVPPELPWQRTKQDPVGIRYSAARRARLWPLLHEPLACYARNARVCTYVDVPKMQTFLHELCADSGPVVTPKRYLASQIGFSLAFTAAGFVCRHNGSC